MNANEVPFSAHILDGVPSVHSISDYLVPEEKALLQESRDSVYCVVDDVSTNCFQKQQDCE